MRPIDLNGVVVEEVREIHHEARANNGSNANQSSGSSERWFRRQRRSYNDESHEGDSNEQPDARYHEEVDHGEAEIGVERGEGDGVGYPRSWVSREKEDKLLAWVLVLDITWSVDFL